MKHRFIHYALLLLGITLIISLVACEGTQEPAIQWSKTFDGVSGSIQQTIDGGYIVCGNTEYYLGDGLSGWLIKTDAEGNKLWEKSLGGVEDCSSWSVQQTIDGGYIVCGTATSVSPEKTKVSLIKTDAEGDKLWDRTFSDEREGFGISVQQTTDGGYILLGTTGSYGNSADIWAIKTDADGNNLWDKTFGGAEVDMGSSVQQTTDGGYIICGTKKFYEAGYNGIWLIKTDANGNKTWDVTFGGGENDYGSSVRQTTDGGYIVCGSKYSSARIVNPNIWLIKVDADGNQIWDKTFGGKVWAEGSSVMQTQNGGYIISGISNYRNIWLINVDADGNTLWDKKLGVKGEAWGFLVQQTRDGGYIVCGTIEPYKGEGSKVMLLKIAPEQ